MLRIRITIKDHRGPFNRCTGFTYYIGTGKMYRIISRNVYMALRTGNGIMYGFLFTIGIIYIPFFRTDSKSNTTSY